MGEFADFCGICGIALTQYEVAGVLSGTYINYDIRDRGSLELVFCSDCQNKLLEIVKGDMSAAVNKRLAIEGQTHGRTKLRRQKDKDKEDGSSGGEVPIVPPA